MLDFPFSTTHFETTAKELCWENEESLLMEVINGQ